MEKRNPLKWTDRSRKGERFRVFMDEPKNGSKFRRFRGLYGRDFYFSDFNAEWLLWPQETNQNIFGVTADFETLLLFDIGNPKHLVAETPCPDTWEEAKAWLLMASQLTAT